MVKRRISKIILNNTSNPSITDNRIIRDMALSIINDLTIEDIKKLFKVNIIDPDSVEQVAKLYDKNVSPSERELIKILRDSNEVLFEVEIDIN